MNICSMNGKRGVVVLQKVIMLSKISNFLTPSFTRTYSAAGLAFFALFSACQEKQDFRLATAPYETQAAANEAQEASDKSAGISQSGNLPARIREVLAPREDIQIWPRQSCVVSFSCTFPEDSATLRDVIWYGASVNPDISAAVAREKAANADVRAALYAFGPTPSLALDADYLTLELAQPLFSGGALRIALESARKRAEIAAADVRIAQLEIAISITNAYGRWLSAHLSELIWRDALAAQQLVVESLQRRVEAGLSNETELTQARSQLVSTRREVFSASVNRQRALNEISVAIGTTISEQAMIAGITTDIPPTPSLNEAKDTTLASSPVIAKAKASVENAEIDLKASKIRTWPIFSFVGRYRDPTSRNPSSASTTKDSYFRVQSNFGAALSFRARISAAQASLEAAQKSLSSSRQAITGTIEQDFVLLASSLENKAAALELTEAAQELLTSNQRQFASGTKRWNDVLSSILELARTKALEIDATGAALLSAWRINIASKTPYGL